VLLARLPCVDSAPQKRSGVSVDLSVYRITGPVYTGTGTGNRYCTGTRYSGRRRAVVRGVRWWAGMVVRFVCVNRVPLCPVCPVSSVSRVCACVRRVPCDCVMPGHMMSVRSAWPSWAPVPPVVF